MHVASGRWLYGFLLALTTTTLWGVLPIMLKEVLNGMDAFTVSWYRMLSSGLVLLAWLGVRRRLPSVRALRLKTWKWPRYRSRKRRQGVHSPRSAR